ADARADRRFRDHRPARPLPGADRRARRCWRGRDLDRLPERQAGPDPPRRRYDHSGAGRDSCMKRLGVDVGGTFTDLILVDEESGRTSVDKVPSTPDDPARGSADGIRALCAKGNVRLAEIDNLLHGTTVATNIELTHAGAAD